jgi:hypothetical protein
MKDLWAQEEDSRQLLPNKQKSKGRGSIRVRSVHVWALLETGEDRLWTLSPRA